MTEPTSRLGEDDRRLATLNMLKDALRAEHGSVTLRVSGQCMEPLIVDGDEITVESFDGAPVFAELVLGHLPTGDLVCHRVVALDPEGFWLAGDRSLHADRHDGESLIGRVRSIRRGSARLEIATPDLRHRLQARLGGWARRRRHRPWIRAIEWPRRLLIEWQAIGWWWARLRSIQGRSRRPRS